MIERLVRDGCVQAVVVFGLAVCLPAAGKPGTNERVDRTHPPAARAPRQKGPPRYWQTYRVGKGEDLAEIAKTLGVEVADLKKWNRLRTNQLKAGMRLKFYGPRLEPQSVGRPSDGRLIAGVSLDPDGDNQGTGWVIAARREATFGTPETIRAVRKCVAQYRHNFARSRADPVAIGDLSKRGGGPLPPHKSHQSGRDVDIGFILKKRSQNAMEGALRNATADTLDAEKQWVLTRCFLELPETQVIWMAHPIVAALKEYVQKIYKKRKNLLKKYLSYFPGGARALIQADEDHTSHMHVRFRCPSGDRQCVQ